jgi:protein-S-isoprenylcysteine O-methyltransferase Ste14
LQDAACCETDAPAVSSSTEQLGQVLFRLRSISPVPVILVCGWALWTRQGGAGPGGESVDLALDLAGLALAVVGQVLRFYVLGWVPEGTSGQNLSIQASTLNTTGPYAYVRNPLYVGNLGIVLGLCAIAHHPWVYVATLGFFFGEYFFIIRAEEAFLRSKFGAAFDEFCRTVPRWIPRFSPAKEGALRAGPPAPAPRRNGAEGCRAGPAAGSSCRRRWGPPGRCRFPVRAGNSRRRPP